VEAAYAFAVDVDRDAPPFDGPALIVLGRQDSVVGYRDALGLVDRFRRATVAVVDTAGHNLMSERPAVLAALVDDWLARVELAERLG
jgi:pimeloyl-ACP methyl ester carboxylesterase